MSGFNTDQFNEAPFNSGSSVTPPEPTPPGPTPVGPTVLKLESGGTDYTPVTVWKEFKLSFREFGVAATFMIDATGLSDLPGCNDSFVLTMPSGEVFVLPSIGTPVTGWFSNGTSEDPIFVYSYECVDVVTALDRIPLPSVQLVQTNAGTIIQSLLATMDPTLDVSQVAAGNVVPYVDTADFSKFSDLIKMDAIGTGGYTVQVDPKTNGGLAVIADFKDSFPVSGVTVDKDSEDFSPRKEQIEPDNQIVNSQRVKSTKPGPHHTVMEARELDALNPSFKLKSLPYGLEGTELLNVQIDGGDVSSQDTSDFPKIAPIQHPVQIEVADISLGSAGTLFGFVANGVTQLAVVVGASSIGANVGGSSFTEATPFAPGAPAADLNHQFFYDWYAQFTAAGLSISITENFLNNLAGETALATVTSIDYSTGVVGLTFMAVADVFGLPESIRFFASSDPSEVHAFSTIKSRSGSTITIDNISPDIVVGDKLASADSASVTQTEKVVYSGAAPALQYGVPTLVISGGSGVRATSWTASYGPPIEAILMANPYTGLPGRRLRVDTLASRSTDLVVSRSGNGAVCTMVSDRLPLRGVSRIILNYDAAKTVDVTVADAGSIANCGIRQGSVIESDAVLTVAEAEALGNAVLAEFANPKPKGTITRESPLCSSFPCPNYTVGIDVPAEYRIAATTVPIAEVSVDFGGYSWELNEGVLIYHVTLGQLDLQEIVRRQLLAQQTAVGTAFRPLSAPGSRISSFTWNDVDNVTIGVSGSVTLNGQPASASFNPHDFAVGVVDGPLVLSGTVTSGGTVGELLVEVIEPPADIDAGTSTCSFSAKTNQITHRWGRPPRAISYKIQRKVDDGTGTDTLVFKNIDEIFTEQYPLPYEPLSKKIRVLTIGLGDKQNPGGYIELDCILPPLSAPTPFTLTLGKPIKPATGRVHLFVGPPPIGDHITGRAEFLRVLMSRSPLNDPPTIRGDFSETDTEFVKQNFLATGQTAAFHVTAQYEESEPGDAIWIAAVWVDRFGDEGAMTVPFDALHPPVTVGSIQLIDFFQSAPQAQGGTVEDDNETTPEVDFTGKFRLHLGSNIAHVKMWFDESIPIRKGGTYDPDTELHTHVFDVTDQNVLDGYIDIQKKQAFRWTKKNQRKYRPHTIVFKGPNVRTRVDGSGDIEVTHENRYLVGYDGSPPALVPHTIDEVFDKTLFEFLPGIAGLANNFDVVAGVDANSKPSKLKVDWDRFADDASIRRYLVVIHTANFGTKGPGTDLAIATDLNLIATHGSLLVYDPTNTTRNVTAQVYDAGDRGHHNFDNGDQVGTLTITPGTTYFVSVIAQLQNGRYSTVFAAPVNSVTGTVAAPEDTAVPSGLVAISFIKQKKANLVVRIPIPTAQIFTYTHNLVVIASANAPAAGVKVLSASDLSTALTLGSADDSVGRLEATIKKTEIEVDRQTLEAAFGVGTNVFLWYYAVNQFGGTGVSLRSPSSAPYNVSSGELNYIAPDSQAPDQPSAPLLKVRKNHIRVLEDRPSTRMNVFVNLAIVARVKNAGGTVVGYVVDFTNPATTPTNSAVEFKNNQAADWNNTFLWSKADIQSLYTPLGGTKIEFFVYLTNSFGESAAGAVSPASTLDIASWETDVAAQPPSAAPSAPSTPISNEPTVGKTNEATVVCRVFANASNPAATFASTGTTGLTLIFTNPKGKPQEFPHVVTNPAAVSADVTLPMTLGGLYTWTSTLGTNSGGFISSATGAIQIAAGGFATNAALITGLAITGIRPIDARHSYVDFGYTQPATPVALESEIALEKLGVLLNGTPAETVFSEEKIRPVLGDPTILVAGAKTRTIKVAHPKKNAAQYQIRLVSIDGTSITSGTFSTTSQDEDTALPGNGGSVPITKARLKPGGSLVVRFEMPTVQMATHLRNVLIINDGLSPLRYYSPEDSTWLTAAQWTSNFPTSSGPGEISLGKGGVTGIKIAPAEIFVGGRTVFFAQIGVWNAVGPIYTTAPGAQIDKTGGSNPAGPDELLFDTAAPNGGTTLTAPTVYFVQNNGIVIDFNLTGLTSMNTHLFNSVRVGNSGETQFLDIPTKALIGDSLVSKKQIGKGGHTQVSITRKKLRDLFGPTAVLSIRYFVQNNSGVLGNTAVLGETQSAASTMNLATISDTVNEFGLEVDAKIPLKTYAHGPVNLVVGGNFLASRDAFNVAFGGASVPADADFPGDRWHTAPNQNGSTRIRASAATNGIQWIPTQHSLLLASNVASLGGKICAKLVKRSIIAGETYSVQIVTKNNSGLLTNWTYSLFDEGLGVTIPGTLVTTLSPDASSSYITHGATMVVSTGYAPSNGRQWLIITPSDDSFSTRQIDLVCLVKYAQQMPWFPALEEVWVVADTSIVGDTTAGGVVPGGGGGGGAPFLPGAGGNMGYTG